MKIKRSLSVCLAFLVLTGAVAAQTSFDTFWKKFQAAFVKGDTATVASLTAFPFSLGYDPGAKGGVGYITTKARFLRQYKKLFDGEVDTAKCFKSAVPEKDNKDYSVACGFRGEPQNSEKPNVYIFKLTKLGWRFAGATNINE